MEADITDMSDRPGPECREVSDCSVSVTVRQGFPPAISLEWSSRPSADRKRLRSISRVFQSICGAFGRQELLSSRRADTNWTRSPRVHAWGQCAGSWAQPCHRLDRDGYSDTSSWIACSVRRSFARYRPFISAVHRGGLFDSLGLYGFSAAVSTSLHSAARPTRDSLERLCRYIAHPAVSNERLSVNDRAPVVYRLKHPFHDGTTHLVLNRLDFLARLAALVPRPRPPILVNTTLRQEFSAAVGPGRSRRPPATRKRPRVISRVFRSVSGEQGVKVV